MRFISYIRPVPRLREVAVLANTQKTENQRKMEKQEYVEFQTKEKGKSPETDLKEMEISYLSDRELKITITKMFTKIRRARHE